MTSPNTSDSYHNQYVTGTVQTHRPRTQYIGTMPVSGWGSGRQSKDKPGGASATGVGNKDRNCKNETKMALCLVALMSLLLYWSCFPTGFWSLRLQGEVWGWLSVRVARAASYWSRRAARRLSYQIWVLWPHVSGFKLAIAGLFSPGAKCFNSELSAS